MSYLGQQLGQGQAERFIYTATGGETSVTSDDLGRGIAYTVGQVDVYLNGAKLINGADFTATTGTSITGLTALTASDVLEVFALSIFQASDTVSAASGGTFNGNVTVDANLSVTGTVDINGGAIDGTTIGGTTPAAGSFTTLTASGDVNFDSGTLFVDESTNRVGVGTSSPAVKLEISDDIAIRGGSDRRITLGSSGTIGANDSNHLRADGTVLKFNSAGGEYIFEQNGSEAMRIDSSGNVGIGETSPARALDVVSSQDYQLQLSNGSPAGHYELGRNATTGAFHFYGNQSGDIAYVFDGADGERMRIDSSGNVLVGTTLTPASLSSTSSEEGMAIGGDGLVTIANSAQSPLVLNRLSSDGNILNFYKDGSPMGSIGVANGDNLYIAADDTTDVGLKFDGDANAIYGCNASGGIRDAAITLGDPAVRFKDLYLSGGVYLGGTGSANHLDDYEEGTWTPTVTTGTTTVNSATYIKIGRKVTVFVGNQSFSDSSSAGAVIVGGLPFGVAEHSVGSVLCSERDDTAAVITFVSKTSNDVSFYENSSTTSFSQKAHNNFIETTGALYWTLTYYTD